MQIETWIFVDMQKVYASICVNIYSQPTLWYNVLKKCIHNYEGFNTQRV